MLFLESWKRLFKESLKYFVGSGYFGLIKVPSEVKENLESIGIKVIAQPSERLARPTIASYGLERKVIVALHITC